MHFVQSLSAVLFSGQEYFISVVAIILSLSIPIVAIITTFYAKHRREQMWHETARIALEKGQPIPSRPLSDEELRHQPPPAEANLANWDRHQRARRRRKDARNGLVLIAIGAALAGGHFEAKFISYVPLFIGFALLLNALLDALFSNKSDDSGPRPPQS
jgi:hypothetical protein